VSDEEKMRPGLGQCSEFTSVPCHCCMRDRKNIRLLNPCHVLPNVLLQKKWKKIDWGRKEKGKEEYLSIAIYTTHSLIVLRHGSHIFTCKLHHVCLSRPANASALDKKEWSPFGRSRQTAKKKS